MASSTILPSGQLALLDDRSPQLAGWSSRQLGVFGDNRRRPIHRWFPFVEGYSAELVQMALAGRDQGAVRLLDPFGGSGTTALEAAFNGVDSLFAEVNPYLAWVAVTKLNASRAVSEAADWEALSRVSVSLRRLRKTGVVRTHPLLEADAKRCFFPPGVAQRIVDVVAWIDDQTEGAIRDLSRLAVATAIIPASNMVRRTDLRRRVGGDPQPVDLVASVTSNLEMMATDLRHVGGMIAGQCRRIATDARRLRATDTWNLIVTSPPYLNGTNYCRNTKLELLALGFIESERDLSPLRTEAITAGINNVSSRRTTPDQISAVEDIAVDLDQKAYDPRIPALVRGYFSDMRAVIRCLRAGAEQGAAFFLDIGDSRFAGIHVPTDRLLIEIAELEGWELIKRSVLRSRRSYDGSPLIQALIELRAQ